MQPTIVRVDYNDTFHGECLTRMLDSYARDPMGGGTPLAETVKQQLPSALAARPGAFSVLAFAGDEPVGLVNCFEGFSTFSCKPLVNIHDVVVHPDYRRQGISSRMLEEVERIARERGCCKLTLEVLAGNLPAQNVYRRFGFGSYCLDPAMGQAVFWEKKLVSGQ